ncbi:MAG: four helix bundle protein [Verrucomicrobiota bacterium]
MEFKQFLGYARGSCGELRTQLIIAERLGYLPSDKARAWISESREISKMLWGLTKSLGR